MRKIACFTLIMLLGWQVSWAQDLLVKGVVTGAEDGLTIPGVSVVVKGTTNGTTTDFDGKYEIKVGTNTTLVFTYIGMKPFEAKVGSQSKVNVALETDNFTMDEVVVTAMGIKRDRKALNYAVQEVKGVELSSTQQNNVAEILSGRIAGVNVVNTSGDVGSSTSIVIRGGSSLGGGNQPLFIVDGIPIDNTSVSTRDFDDINRAADIDPEDIASVSVLKGPSAAALYGINAAGGAIVITTKKGEKGEGRITYSNNFKISEVANLPDYQNSYMHGYNGATTSTVFNNWGPPLSSNDRVYDNLDNFFTTGFSQKHHLEFSNSNEKGSYRLSISHNDQNGVVPNSNYNTSSMRINTSQKLKDWLTVDASANYVHAESDKSSKGSNGFYRQLLVYPVNHDAEDWKSDDGTYKSITDGTAGTDNPYFTVNNDRTESKTDRIIANTSFIIKPVKEFTATGRFGSDFYTTRGRSYVMPGSTIANNSKGRLREFQRTSHVKNATLLIHFEKDFTEDINVSILGGASLEDYDYWSDLRSGAEFKNPDFIGMANIDAESLRTSTSRTQRRRSGVFGEAKFNYKKMLYLGVTGRNDWSSTLPEINNSFFYPSYSVGLIFSELMEDKSILSFGKIRASWSEVGKDASPYVVGTSLSVNGKSGGGFYNGYSGGNPYLKPETTTALEFGCDLRFFNGRFNLDFTYYNQESKDMIINPRLSYTTGYIFFYMNGGVISNKGLELQAKVIPIKNKNFTWDFIANYSQNRGVLKSLPYPLEEYYESDTWVYGNIRNGAKPGEAFSGLTGFDYKRTEQGETIVDKSGYPVRESKYVVLGDREPDFLLGLTNTIQYKRFRLSFLLDIRVGGDVYNGTKAYMTSRGASDITANRGQQFMVDGVVETGVDEAGNATYAKNTNPIQLDRNFYQSYFANVESNFIENVNIMRLRNLSMSYRFSTKNWEKRFIEDMTISFTGYNLALWSNYTGGDPEVNTLGAGARGSGGAGIDYGVLPSPRSYSIGLKVKF